MWPKFKDADDHVPVGLTPDHPNTGPEQHLYETLQLKDGMEKRMLTTHSYVKLSTVWEMDIQDVQRLWAKPDTRWPVLQLEAHSYIQLMILLHERYCEYRLEPQHVVTAAEPQECQRREGWTFAGGRNPKFNREPSVPPWRMEWRREYQDIGEQDKQGVCGEEVETIGGSEIEQPGLDRDTDEDDEESSVQT
jgi:hypothetical protein